MTIEPHTPSLPGQDISDAPVMLGRSKATAKSKRAREHLVILSMCLVTAATAAVLFALFDFSLAAAVLSGGLMWAALMTVHLQVKKNVEIARLKSDVARLEAHRLALGSPEMQGAHASGSNATDSDRTRSPRRAAPPASAAAPPSASADGAESGNPATPPASQRGPQPHPRWEMPGQTRAVPAPMANAQSTPPNESANARSSHQILSPAAETALWPGTSLSASDPMRDQWAFRPKEPAAPVLPLPRDVDDLPMTSLPPSNIDADLEIVQRKIKALADEVNAADLMRDRQPPLAGAPTAQSAMEKSIGALKATADSMRERSSSPSTRSQPAEPAAGSRSPAPQNQTMPFELMIPASAETIAASDPRQPQGTAAQTAAARGSPPMADLPPLPVFEFALPSPAPANPRIAAIAAAIESGAMDVFLSPIVALQSHQVSHYDVTVRIKQANGAYLDDAEQQLQLAGSDVLALFDTARLKRAAALAHRLDAHNKQGSLLSPVNGPSITNAEFLETFARVYEERDRISNQLVLTFSQADLEQFSPSAWQALSDMQAFGFRFALAKIDHVAMDFATLAQRGFTFLRLEASALINGLPARDRFMGADELCRHLAGAGMTLVADTIDDEEIRARVFGFGVLFGQGRLFGGARQVKLDSLPAGSSAAA